MNPRVVWISGVDAHTNRHADYFSDAPAITDERRDLGLQARGALR